jgi:hypothetical protein
MQRSLEMEDANLVPHVVPSLYVEATDTTSTRLPPPPPEQLDELDLFRTQFGGVVEDLMALFNGDVTFTLESLWTMSKQQKEVEAREPSLEYELESKPEAEQITKSGARRR